MTSRKVLVFEKLVGGAKCNACNACIFGAAYSCECTDLLRELGDCCKDGGVFIIKEIVCI